MFVLCLEENRVVMARFIPQPKNPFFGLIADDMLYLKVDATNRPDFERDNLEPFVYPKDGQPMAMSDHRAPDVLDDWERIEPWVVGALEAAHRAGAKARPKSTHKKSTS